MNSKVSIIVPVYRIPENALNACIGSIINQTYKNLEVLLIDDGSPDDSGKICDNAAAKDSRIKALHKDNGGVSSARNMGIKNASGEYILFVDADDYLHPRAVDIMLRTAIDTDTDIVICSYKRFFTDDPVIDNKCEDLNIKTFRQESDIRSLQSKCLIEDGVLGVRFNGAPWCKLYSANIIKEHNLHFDTTMKRSQDNFFNLQVFQHVSSITFVNAQLYYYRYLENSSVNRFRPTLYQISSIYLYALKKYLLENNIKLERTYTYVCIEKLSEFLGGYIFHPQNENSKAENKELINQAYYNWLPDFSEQKLRDLHCNFRTYLFMILLIKEKYYGLLLYYRLLKILRIIKIHITAVPFRNPWVQIG